MEPTYTNPIIDADWPDPDAIRVGERYVMITSSFNRSPGLPVLTSTNLVDWNIASHAVPRLLPEEHFGLVRPGGGIWAPSIRHHDGTYFIVYPDPDHGVFVVTATDPAGPWSEPHLLFAERGAIDPCPVWDEDGRTYLIHAWAPSRSGMGNRLDMLEVSPDLRRVLSPRRTVIDGDAVPGCHTLEGPKLYVARGYRWIFAPAGGVATGWQSVFRATSWEGPWEHRVVLAQEDTDVNGPHQGAWVTTPGGEDWFLHFQDRGPFGRVVHLQPLSWTEEGWPVIGEPVRDGTSGRPVASHRTPDFLPREEVSPATSDSFTATELGLQWTFAANPPANAYRLDGEGRLALRCLPNDHDDLRALPQALTQPVPGQASRTRVELQLTGTGTARAGLAVLGVETLWVGLRRDAAGRTLLVAEHSAAGATHRELLPAHELAPGEDAHLALCVEIDGAGLARLSWELPDAASAPSEGVAITAGRWVGAELALFAAAPFGETGNEEAFFSSFMVEAQE